MKPRGFAGLALLLVLLVGPAAPLKPNALVADLSDHLVAITTGFAGAKVLLFGAVDGPGDVAVIVRGPESSVVMHRKSRLAGIWVNTASMTFDRVPSFYAVAASRPLEEIASVGARARNEIGLDFLDLALPHAKASENIANEWRAALKRNKQRLGLYSTTVGRVRFLGNRLFRTDIFFPANVPTGAYQVQVYLLRDGEVIGAQTTPLIVSKIGAEAEIFDFAHHQSALYGVIAVLVALVAGWLAHVAFRKS
ncbi:MAG: TIGR02186 family protein [Kiloniellales bacterium]